MKRFDVCIVGAGLGGLQCARLLSREGLSVLLVDRKRSLTESVHTTGIFVRRTLEDFDLPEDCLGPPVRRVVLYSPRRRALKLESPLDEFRVGRMGELYQRFLDEAVEAGAEWWPSTRYVGIETESDSCSILHLETNGLTRSVEARFIVGADGAQSRVARDLGLDSNREWIVGVEDVFHHPPDKSAEPVFHCFMDSSLAPGYIAWVVQDGEETHVGVGGYAKDFDAASALEKFRASLKGTIDLEALKRTERRGGRIPVGGVLRRIANERGLLVGDAAGAVSPLTAGGLDPCMRLSSLAADVISRFLSTGETTELGRYSGQEFRSRFVSRIWMRRAISLVRQPLLLEACCAVMRLPLFKHLAWHVFFGRGSFPDVQKRGATTELSPRKALT
ncbi:MAG TPA: NAD(P)/FAD-dependent oxidoreductase [Pyrinomonadaceae bacterium]|nr:NAD(P)/FAD-dependent oxidoreductase [Pyrinomonadaceae bacterium]